jgi:hypothetical protein
MNQEVATSKAIESIKIQVGKLTPNLELVIFNHLYLMYSVGMSEGLKLVQTKSKKVISISPAGNESSFMSIRDASRILKLRRDSIRDVLEGRQSNYKGYKFMYE